MVGSPGRHTLLSLFWALCHTAAEMSLRVLAAIVSASLFAGASFHAMTSVIQNPKRKQHSNQEAEDAIEQLDALKNLAGRTEQQSGSPSLEHPKSRSSQRTELKEQEETVAVHYVLCHLQSLASRELEPIPECTQEEHSTEHDAMDASSKATSAASLRTLHGNLYRIQQSMLTAPRRVRNALRDTAARLEQQIEVAASRLVRQRKVGVLDRGTINSTCSPGESL